MSTCGQDSLSLNVYMNTQIEIKKLKFHTQDKEGKSKCHKIHVGPKSKICPKLEVHGTEMIEVDYDTYLGDKVSGDGKNTRNIKKRISKGLGIISDRMNILEKVTLGEFYFSTALLLRESLFLNGILTNAEVWYGLTQAEIKELENLDCLLLRKIFNTKCSVPYESLFLEFGCLNIETILKARRLNYLHYLVTGNKSKMLYNFFLAQWKYPTTNDWTEQVRKDMDDFGFGNSLALIESKSKHSFKKLIKSKAKEFAFFSLIEKKETHSKMEDLFYTELKPQEYLSGNNLSAKQAQTVFSYRTRMADYSENFRNNGGHSPCQLCLMHLDSQAHSFSCPVILSNIKINVCYSDIFNKVSKKLANTLVKIETFRNEYKNTRK